ncbi:MAG: hypothetical protein J7L43_01965, partial [Candidatus Aenigmarchaeota archaeon]|nr:hypothetical protein [Candidatus Aenigmarchaeota archaeon]
NIMQPGTVKKEGNLIISYGPSVKAYIADADNDGTDDYVLENNIITFAVKKLYSSSNQGEINMSDPSTKIVSLIENKMTNTVIHPTFKVSFNDDLNTMYGTGYTELVTNGDNLPEGIIKLHMECPNTKNHLKYEVVFTLYPGQDFVHVEVNKV